MTKTIRVERVSGSLHRRLIDGVTHVRASKLAWWDKSIRRKKDGKSLTGWRGRRRVRHMRRDYVALDDGSVYVAIP